MHYTRLVSLSLRDLHADDFDTMPIVKHDETASFKSKARLEELNFIVRNNRDYLMSLVRDGGSGFFAMEHDKNEGVFGDMAALFTGKKLENFAYTQVEVRPKDQICALKIADLFMFDTNVKFATFETRDGEKHVVKNPLEVVDIIRYIEEVKGL